MANTKFQTIIKELFIRYRKLDISLVFIIQLFQKKLDYTHYLIMKIHNKRQLQQVVINHLADVDYKNLINIYKMASREQYSFLTIDTTFPANDPLRENLLLSY